MFLPRGPEDPLLCAPPMGPRHVICGHIIPEPQFPHLCCEVQQ